MGEEIKKDSDQEIIDDTIGLVKKIVHRILDCLIGDTKKKLEKIASDKNVRINYEKEITGEEKHE